MSSWMWLTHWSLHNTLAPTKVRSVVSRMVMIITGIFTIHSLTLYQGCLLSQLVRPEAPVPLVRSFDDITQLISRKEAILNLVNAEFVNAVSIMEEPIYKQLRQALSLNPPIFLDSRIPSQHRKLAELNARHKVISFETMETIVDSMSHDNCEYLVVSTGAYLTQAFMIAPSVNESTLQCLDLAIINNLSRILAILEDHRNSRLRAYQQCREDMYTKMERPVGEPVRMIRLSGCFSLLAMGLILSLAYFAFELFRVLNIRAYII